MKHTQIRGLKSGVSSIGLGCRSLGKVSDKAGIGIIQEAVNQGINLFDTAPNYGSGRSESILGEGIKDYRDEVVLCTKAGLTVDQKGRHSQDSKPKTILRSVERSLHRLQTDHIDILTLHYPDPIVPPAETIRAIDQLLKEGKILRFGVSNFDSKEIAHWSQNIDIATAQTQYNLLLRDIEEELLPLCREKEITILGYVPLLAGLLTEGILRQEEVPPSDARSLLPQEILEGCREIVLRLRDIAQHNECTVAQLALAWTLSKQGVLPLVGATNVRHLRENVRAVDLELEEGVFRRMEKAASEIDPRIHTPMPMKVESVMKGYDGARVGLLSMGFKIRLSSSLEKGDLVLMDPWTGKTLEN